MTCPPELPIQGSEDKVVQQLCLRNVWNPCGAKVSVKKKKKKGNLGQNHVFRPTSSPNV